MKVYLNRIEGIADAIVSMYISKKNWSREKEEHIRYICDNVLDRNGFPYKIPNPKYWEEFQDMLSKLIKWGKKHYTMLRYIDFSVTVEGLHRGGQDDFSAHAMRLNNRIIRSSTRLADFEQNEMSDFYKGKIIPTDEALKILEIQIPDRILYKGKHYIKSVNGYIEEKYKDNKDVKRGLYMISIPSNFLFKVNLTELAHIMKERDKNSNANPEVIEMMEKLKSLIESFYSIIDEQFYYEIKN